MAESDGRLRTSLFTIFALLAFAANSLLCRSALGQHTIDAASFTTIRLLSGAVTLWVIARVVTRTPREPGQGSWGSAVALFVYAVGFSLSYLSLSAGTGALLLFGAVQITMLVAGWRAGERPHAWQWRGSFLAVGGLVVLVFPGLTAPPPVGAMLMVLAGVAWGVYSLRGRGTSDPVAATADNFIRSVPFAALTSVASLSTVHVSSSGVWLAVLSGALASGIGYVVWYAALRGLTAIRAAAVQLAVPILVGLGGVLLLSEAAPLRLMTSAICIVGGIGLTMIRAGNESNPRAEGPRV